MSLLKNNNELESNLIDKNELTKELRSKGIPIYYAKEIIKRYGDKNGLIDETLALNIIKNLQISLNNIKSFTKDNI